MTRVLVVHSGNMYGGVERVLDTLAQAPRFCPDLDPSFALCFEGCPSESLRQLGAKVTILGDVRVTRLDLVLRARRRFAATIEAVRPDVILTPSAWAHTIFAPVARRAGLPLLLWVHDELSGTPWLERLAARHSPDLMICNSQFTLRAARHVFPDAPAQVIYCPLAFEEPSTPRSDVRRELQTDDAAMVVINVARMEPLKGHLTLIDALAVLRVSTPWVCWIVGGAQRPEEEQYQRSLAERVAAHGLQDRVRFLGQRSDVPSLLGASDLYCHPNQGTETFGLSIVEALHAGLPVVASGAGGPEEILAGACGHLLPPGDVQALAHALDGLLADNAARRQLANAGPARAAELCDPYARLADVAAAMTRVRVKVAA